MRLSYSLLGAFLLFIFHQSSKAQHETVVHQINDTVELTLVRSTFDPADHHVLADKGFVYAVDGAPIFGTDADLPRFKLHQVTLKMGAFEHALDVDHMYNPWFGEDINPNLIHFFKDGTNHHLQVILSDGAGSYGAEWLIIGESSVRTILTRDERILFEYFGSP
jgi:hypothetical protein